MLTTARRASATTTLPLVAGHSLAVVRVAFGAIALLSALRLVTRGWVATLYVAPVEHLRYPGLGWVPVPPGWAMYLLVAVIGAAAVGVLLGWHYRTAIITFWVAFTWLELVEATVYLNHYWFMTLAGALMAVLPMNAAWSLDARRRGTRAVPLGAVWMLRVQVGVVYAFAGLAKLHGDWLADGLPLGLWLPARSHLPLVGALLAEPRTALVASWAGAAFDCLVVAFLLWPRTRVAAWLVGVSFHLITWWLFPSIGVFPWLMIAMSTVFFAPDWPIRVLSHLRIRTAHATAGDVPDPDPPPHPPTPLRPALLAVVAVWVVVQVALPMRHLAYPGDHRWSGEGFRFGWNVMLVEKAGAVSFRLTDPTTGATEVADLSSRYTRQQQQVLATDPELIRQAAHALADAEERSGEPRPEVAVDAMVSLNGRPAARLVDQSVDLAAEPWRLGLQRWILPAPTTPPPR